MTEIIIFVAGMCVGGAIIWMKRSWVEARKATVEAAAKSVKKKL